MAAMPSRSSRSAKATQSSWKLRFCTGSVLAPPPPRGGVARARSLRVGAHGFRDVGRRPAARGIGDAAVAAREIPDLRFPAQIVAAELVYEQDRIARSGLLMIEPYTLAGRDRGHRVASWFGAFGPRAPPAARSPRG